MLISKLEADITAAATAACFPVMNLNVHLSQRPELGQFQISAAMGLARTLRRPPAAIAADIEAIVSTLPYVRDIRTDGPGFVNFSVTDEFLTGAATVLREDPAQIRVRPDSVSQTIFMDYGGPNVAKGLHVGHLRSGVIGDTLRRMGLYLGHRVIADVHLGDWGLPMGKILLGLLTQRPDLEDIDPAKLGECWEAPDINDLNSIYKRESDLCGASAHRLEAAREITVRLQDGDPLLRGMWKVICHMSVQVAKAEYDRLDVQFDLWRGESNSADRLGKLISRLREAGTAVISEGALVVHLADTDSGSGSPTPPLILEKTGGGVMYGGTDLAAIQERVEEFDPDYILYIVDQRQHMHFSQVFRAAEIAGLTGGGRPRLEHVGFGTVNGADGLPLKTRAGDAKPLGELYSESADSARGRLVGEGREQAAEFSVTVHRMAVAAIRFADLSTGRRSDYIFNPERFSAAEGKTGAYLCYSRARALAVVSKSATAGFTAGLIGELVTPHEKTLIVQMLGFYTAVQQSFGTRQPHIFCEHLFETAQAYNAFYHSVQVLSEEDAARRSSLLALHTMFAGQMKAGLGLLGIEPPDRL